MVRILMMLGAGYSLPAPIRQWDSECLGLSPSVYLKLRRLNLCRIRLARADPAAVTVKDVVARTGFRDSGRFAAEYRAYFGELPSDTLRRRARPVPQAFRLEL